MERKRRARINESLNELKSLVLTGMRKDVSRFTFAIILNVTYPTCQIKVICGVQVNQFKSVLLWWVRNVKDEQVGCTVIFEFETDIHINHSCVVI